MLQVQSPNVWVSKASWLLTGADDARSSSCPQIHQKTPPCPPVGGQLSPRSQTGLPSGPPLPRRGGGQALPRRAARRRGLPRPPEGAGERGGRAGCGPVTCGCGRGSPPLPLPEVSWSGSLGPALPRGGPGGLDEAAGAGGPHSARGINRAGSDAPPSRHGRGGRGGGGGGAGARRAG